MSENISLTGQDTFYGTQMKPDIFEPATAEWAGRTAKNAGWLFARQQQVIFAGGKHTDWHQQSCDPAAFTQLHSRRFWLNEVFGTLYVLFNLTFDSWRVTSITISGTLNEGCGNSFNTIGTVDGTYTTEGWKSLTMYTGPDWHKSAINTNYGWLILRTYIVPDDPDIGAEIQVSYLSCTGFPRT